MHGSLIALVALLLLTLPARAARPDCRPLDETGLRGLVSDGVDAVQRGDAEAQRVIADEVEARVPCLTFAPSPRLWADVLVLEAIARFLDKQDWAPALDAALRLRPRVNRLVAPNHPIARHPDPDPTVLTDQLVPAGITVYVDGDRATRLPPTGEVHLVQVQRDGHWRSRVFVDESPDRGFLTSPVAAPAVWSWWGHVAVAVGPGGLIQRPSGGFPTPPDGQTGAYGPETRVGAWPALVARGFARYAAFGASAELDVGLLGLVRPVGSHAQAGLLFGARRLQVGPSVGLGATLATDTIGGDQSFQVPYAGATGVWTTPRASVGGTLGLGPGMGRGHLHAGLALSRAEPGQAVPRLGLSMVAQHAAIVATDGEGGSLPGLDLWSTTWRAGIEIGVMRVQP